MTAPYRIPPSIKLTAYMQSAAFKTQTTDCSGAGASVGVGASPRRGAPRGAESYEGTTPPYSTDRYTV